MNVYVLTETYEMTTRAFADRASARDAVAKSLNEYREGGWTVVKYKSGREYEVYCREEGTYHVFLDYVEVEGGN